MSLEFWPCSNACRETLPMVTFQKFWSFHVSIAVTRMLPPVADGSMSSISIERRLLILSIEFTNVVPDRSLLDSTMLKSMRFVCPIGNITVFCPTHLSGSA